MFEMFIGSVMQKKEQKLEYHPESSPVRRRARNADWKATANQDQGKDRERRFDLVRQNMLILGRGDCVGTGTWNW